MFPEFRKVEKEECFESMILDFATRASKHGLDIDRYEMVVEKPTEMDPFYKISFKAYIDEKVWFSSDAGLTSDLRDLVNLVISEKVSSKKYNLPLKIMM